MRITIPIVFAIFISVIHCKEDNVQKGNVDNLIILRNSVNFAYKAGNNFLDLIRGSTPPHKPILHTYKTFYSSENTEPIKLTDFLPMGLPYVGFLSLLVAGLLFVIFVPLVGFCFCLCRCSNKCGGKVKGMDTKHATCKRYTYALFLGIITVVQLAGIVLAFINNQLIHDTLTNPSERINAVKQISTGTELLKSSLANISEAIKDSEKSSGNSELKTINNTDFSAMICDKYLSALEKHSASLNLEGDLRMIDIKLNEFVSYLDHVKIEHTKLKVYVNDYGTTFANLKVINIRPQVCGMVAKIFNSDFDVLRSSMSAQLKAGSNTGKKLREIVEFLNSTAMTYLDRFGRNANEYMKVEFLDYRMYLCIVLCCLLLLIIIFYFLGLCFGQCGERPFEDAKICNRGVGANLMMAGVAFAFLLTPMIMTFEMGLFMVGGVIQTDICRYATNSYAPGMLTFDAALRAVPNLKKYKFIENNMMDNIIKKCPSEPMVIAFGVDKDFMSPEIVSSITSISTKVKNIPIKVTSTISDSFFKYVEDLLQNITRETGIIKANSEGYDSATKDNVNNKLMGATTEMLKVTSIKLKFTEGFKTVTGEEVSKNVSDTVRGIYLDPYKNVICNGISASTVNLVDSVCITFLWPVNGFWYGIGICLILTIPSMIFAVKLAGLYRRTEKYSADYEEPDYHSYMGFYTNNADNIPMKRPKSGKSNSKNRNSNPNSNNTNKESIKQNNPQYLPVYPYDAYE